VTDRRTDRILIARPRLHSMQRGKNDHHCPIHGCSRLRYFFDSVVNGFLRQGRSKSKKIILQTSGAFAAQRFCTCDRNTVKNIFVYLARDIFWSRNVVKRGLCYRDVCPSVDPSVCPPICLSVTHESRLNDLERRNRPNGCVISPISVAFWADCVTVVEDTRILSAAENVGHRM